MHSPYPHALPLSPRTPTRIHTHHKYLKHLFLLYLAFSHARTIEFTKDKESPRHIGLPNKTTYAWWALPASLLLLIKTFFHGMVWILLIMHFLNTTWLYDITVDTWKYNSWIKLLNSWTKLFMFYKIKRQQQSVQLTEYVETDWHCELNNNYLIVKH